MQEMKLVVRLGGGDCFDVVLQKPTVLASTIVTSIICQNSSIFIFKAILSVSFILTTWVCVKV